MEQIMQMNTDLEKAGLAATWAAEALQESTKPTAATKRLNLADHTGILEELRITVELIHDQPGPLAWTLWTINVTQERHATLQTAEGRKLTRGLATLEEAIRRARTQSSHANLNPAYERVRADRFRLSGELSPAAGPATSLGRSVLAKVVDVNKTLGAFAMEIKPGDLPVQDVASALGNTAGTVLALKAVCLQEAKLIDATYQHPHLGGHAAVASETLTAAGKALAGAYRTLSSATTTAKQLAVLEAHLLNPDLAQ